MTNNVLVVYYSRSGSTFRVARHLAAALDADLDPIEDPSPRTGIAGYARSALEAIAKGLPTIHTRRDPREYDLVVLGTPVWTGTMASPMRSYLSVHAAHLSNPAFFAVMAGRGGDKTVHEMQVACRASRAPTCVLTQGDVEQGRIRERCAEFIRLLKPPVAREDAAA